MATICLATPSRLSLNVVQLVRGVEAAGADGTLADTCPAFPTLLAWLGSDLAMTAYYLAVISEGFALGMLAECKSQQEQ